MLLARQLANARAAGARGYAIAVSRPIDHSVAGSYEPGHIARIAISAARGVATDTVHTEPATALTGTTGLAVDEQAIAAEASGAAVAGPMGRAIGYRVAGPCGPGDIARAAKVTTAGTAADTIHTVSAPALAAASAGLTVDQVATAAEASGATVAGAIGRAIGYRVTGSDGPRDAARAANATSAGTAADAVDAIAAAAYTGVRAGLAVDQLASTREARGAGAGAGAIGRAIGYRVAGP